MKKEYNFSKMRVKQRGALVGSDAKVQKTIRLDVDVLAWLLRESEERGIAYQTLINSTLKAAMNVGTTKTKELKELIRSVVREELKRAS